MKRILTCVCGFILVMLTQYSIAKESWQTIEQSEFRLIFPTELATEAQRVANQLSYYLTEHQQEITLNKPLKKIDVILLAEAHLANGNVSYAPYRSRWYNRPEPFAQLEWYDALAVHEGRHIVQLNKSYDNPTAKALYTLFGEQSSELFIGLLIPTWYLEGDAVVSETTLTHGGRGRVAAFDLWFRTDLLTNKAYSYDRAMLGTGFDRSPYLSPYVLGYFLTAYMRTTFDPMLFNEVMDKVGTQHGFSFNDSVKGSTGFSLDEIYNQTMLDLKQRWQDQLSALELTPVTVVQNSDVDHWRSDYPIVSSNDQTIALRIDVEKGSHLIGIRGKKVVNIVAIPNATAQHFISGAKTRAITSDGQQHCWIEETAHPTQLNKSFGDLVCWSNRIGRQPLTKGDKLTAVEISTQGYLVHRFNTDRSSELVLLDESGKDLKSHALPDHSLASDIHKTDQGFVFILTGSDQDGIYQIDKNLNRVNALVLNTQATLRSPILTTHWLFYTSDSTGIDQPMAMSLTDGQHYQIAARPFGVYYLTMQHENRLVMSDYTTTGQQLVSIPMSNTAEPLSSWKLIEPLTQHQVYAQSLIRNEQGPRPAPRDYQVSTYRIASNLWNPHSWGFYIDDQQLSGYVESYDVLDKLSLILEAGYNFEASEPIGTVTANYRLNLGPVIGMSLGHTIEGNEGSTTLSQPFIWQRGSQTTLVNATVGVLKDSDDERLTAAVDVSTFKDTPLQAIQTPFGLHQALYVDINRSSELRTLSQTGIVTKGLTARQSFDAASNLQWLETGPSLLTNSPLFNDIQYRDLSGQVSANYRINLGAVGKSFTSAVYWRNTEVSANLRTQFQNSQWESALGLTVAPSLNLARNLYINIKPSFSIYVEPQSKETTFLIGLSIAGQ